MKKYKINIMIQKEGKKPARLGYYDVEATNEQVALGIASAAAKKHLKNLRETLGREPEFRIFAELA